MTSISNSYNIQIISSNRKSLTMHVLPDKTVIVKAPRFTPQFFINKFIAEHQIWIDKRIQQLQNHPIAINRQYQSGELFYYLGTLHSLSTGDYATVFAKDRKILFPQFLQFRMKKELTAWYKQQGEAIITERLEWYAKYMDLAYTGLSFADTKSRWGSCSHDNQLQFNWRLVMAPILVINYVVTHELVHTKVKNHSAEFWRKVRSTNPSYRQQIKWLKEHGESLVI